MDLLKCPKCGSDDISEITGYCVNYSEPLVNGECFTGPGRSMCCGLIEDVRNAWYCNNCQTCFDNKNNLSFDDMCGLSSSPLGEIINEEIYDDDEILYGYQKRMYWSYECIRNELYEVSLILNVSSIETLLKDVFLSNYEKWFNYVEEENELDDKILSFIETYRISNSFTKNILTKSSNQKLSKSNKIDSLFSTISKNFKLLDFQQRYENKGFITRFKFFFNIDLDDFLNKTKYLRKSYKFYFDKMYDDRHKVIHGVELEKPLDKKTAEIYHKVSENFSVFLLDSIKKIKNEHNMF